MTQEIVDSLHALAASIRSIDERVGGLSRFRDKIKQCEAGCFSEAEMAATEEHLRALEQERATLATMLEQKIELYETRVVTLEHVLEVRKSIIDESTGGEALKETPKLLDLLVEQHATLQKQLEEVRTSIVT